jgi:hypothetical protein
LCDLLTERITEPWWMALTELILFHDPRTNFEYRGDPALLDRVPPHKRLTNQPAHLGLPIGNLSSQFFANVYMNVLDQFVKHQLRAHHYLRYVDDFPLLHVSAQWLNEAHAAIAEFLPRRLGIRLNESKTILQPIDRGVDFVGQVIFPWRRTTRRRTLNNALHRISETPVNDLMVVGNSYFGLLGQASHGHHDRAVLANALRYRGQTINGDLRKTFQQSYRAALSHTGSTIHKEAT